MVYRVCTAPSLHVGSLVGVVHWTYFAEFHEDLLSIFGRRDFWRKRILRFVDQRAAHTPTANSSLNLTQTGYTGVLPRADLIYVIDVEINIIEKRIKSSLE